VNARASLLLSLLAIACGPAARPTGPSIAALGGARSIRAITDLEDVRDAVRLEPRLIVATDDGLLLYESPGTPPTRLGLAEGLPSEDVIAITADGDGALVATAAGLVALNGSTLSPVPSVPAMGRITDVAVTTDGSAWVCSLSGLVRRRSGTWEVYGDPFVCTTLAPTPEGQLWVGTTTGLRYIEGGHAETESFREHTTGTGMPEGYVRSLVPVLPGEVLALLSGPTTSRLAFYDSHRWYGYTLPSAGEEVVTGLFDDAGVTYLFGTQHAWVIAPTGGGESLSPTDANEASPHVTEVHVIPLDQAPAPAAPSEGLRAPSRLASVRSSSVHAPGLVARPFDLGTTHLAHGLADADHAYIAIANEGVMTIAHGGGTRYASRSLVHAEDLQMAIDADGAAWIRAADGDIGKMVDGRFRRVPLPREVAPQAIASGAEGAYLVTMLLDAEMHPTTTVQVHVATTTGFRLIAERTLALPSLLDGVPFAGVGPDGHAWLALRIRREGGSGTRMFGAAMIDPAVETVQYDHTGAAQGTGLPIPDDVSTMTFDTAGNAWFATLSGAVRIEAFQAIVFGESRGVRGDVVTDVAQGRGAMWIAAAEGLGSYSDRNFDFFQPPVVTQNRPTTLATSSDGHLWAAGRHGLLEFDGTNWAHFDATSGLPTDDIRDVEVDRQGRVWLLTSDAVLVLEAQRATR
jgi:hypothetical protein